MTKKLDSATARTHNNKKSAYISFLRKKNIRTSKQIERHILENPDLSPGKIDVLTRHAKNIGSCSSKTLYGENEQGQVHYVGSHTCKSKLCFVCNYNRQKRTRHRYNKFFENNNLLLEIYHPERKKWKVITRSQKERFEGNGWILENEKEYDLMHLTLTVPHDKNGWAGQYFYYNEFISAFRELRRRPFWKKWIYGGEYGIETTKTNDNGLHIHMHSLLLVRKGTQNRNKVHKEILIAWNNLTKSDHTEKIDFDAPVESVNHETGEIYQESIANKIKRSNKHITDDDIKKLEPQGARLIRLETIFTMEDGEKVRGKSVESIQKAVMETISYHYEPLMFDKGNQEIDIELLADTAEAVAGQKLYEKFGCLYGEKSLNLMPGKDEEIQEDFSGKETVEDEEQDGKSFSYFMLDPAFVFHDQTRNNEIVMQRKTRERLRYLRANNVQAAINEMAIMIRAELTKR